jgi:hypothetical protein
MCHHLQLRPAEASWRWCSATSKTYRPLFAVCQWQGWVLIHHAFIQDKKHQWQGWVLMHHASGGYKMALLDLKRTSLQGGTDISDRPSRLGRHSWCQSSPARTPFLGVNLTLNFRGPT